MRNDCRKLVYLLLLLCGLYRPALALDASSFYNNFSNTHFVDVNNQSFKPKKLVGKVVLFNFVYTKCSNVCPIQTKQLVEVYSGLPKAYQDKIVFVTVSLDSQYDKPKVLKKYATQMKADFKHWQFLSGAYEDIVKFQKSLYLFGNPNNPAHPRVEIEKLKTRQSEDVLKNHMTILWVVDKKGMLIQRYSAAPMDAQRVGQELKQLVDMN